jgi:hypothetical protein
MSVTKKERNKMALDLCFSKSCWVLFAGFMPEDLFQFIETGFPVEIRESQTTFQCGGGRFCDKWR